MKSSLAILLCLAGVALGAKSYSGYQVLETAPLSGDAAASLVQLRDNQIFFDFWRDPNPGHAAKIMSSPAHMAQLKSFLASHGIEYTVAVEDVQKQIDASQATNKMMKDPNGRYAIDWTDYYGHSDINDFLNEIASEVPGAETYSLGETYEGRDMLALEINNAGPNAPLIFVEAGIHAREWIAPAVATFIINELVNSEPEWMDEFNFRFLPSANPDGYEYSRSDDRLWRKNRSPTSANCYGVDMNRNWEFHWHDSGVSDIPCADTYPGTEAFSEIESRNMRDYFNDFYTKPDLTVCLHSAAELWLYPYGYAYNQYPDNVDDLRRVGQDAVDALNAVNGQTFQLINSAELYPAAGASDDWYQSEGSVLTYTPELRDNGFGFVLPPALIQPSGEEVWAAFKAMFNDILNKKKNE